MNNRWKFITKKEGDTEHLTAVPDVDKLNDYIYTATTELSKTINDIEENLLLQAMSFETLNLLFEKVVFELKRRESFKR